MVRTDRKPPPDGPRLLSALLVPCPAADRVVAAHRLRLDRAAGFGVPAHVTVLFPFRPPAELTEADEERLAYALGRLPRFSLRLARTGWFGEDVLFLEPEPRGPLLDLVRAVEAAFPAYPPYGGVFDEVVPHVTVGDVLHETGGVRPTVEDLRAAERAVAPHLPLVEEVAAVELWAGPPLDGPVGDGWRRLRAFPLA